MCREGVADFSVMTSIRISLLVILFLPILNTFGAPHTSLNTILKQLNCLGCSISSPDNFESSLRCDACQVTLSYPQKTHKAVWMLKRHSREAVHQVKAGWILDNENNVKRSKPRGKFY